MNTGVFLYDGQQFRWVDGVQQHLWVSHLFLELLSWGYWQSAAGQFPSTDLLEGHHLRTNPQEIRAALSSLENLPKFKASVGTGWKRATFPELRQMIFLFFTCRKQARRGRGLHEIKTNISRIREGK